MTDILEKNAIDQGNEVPDDVAAMFDLSKKKKKKKKPVDSEPSTTEQVENLAPSDNTNNPVRSSSSGINYGIELDPPSYDYNQLLDRIVDFLHSKDPAWSEKRRQTLKAPQLSRVGSKKTLWTNFQEICKMIHRNPDHVFQYMMTELGTEGSIDGSSRLVIRGKFVAKVCKYTLHSILTNCLFAVHRITVKKVHRRVCAVSNVPQLEHDLDPRHCLPSKFRQL